MIINEENLLTNYKPKLIEEWDFERNTEEFNKLTKGSGKKVYWICKKCKSSYDCDVSGKVRGRGCPYCAGKRANHTNSLESLFPEVAKYWSEKNNKLASEVTFGSEKQAWWYCDICDIHYEMRTKDKTSNKCGCPYCSSHRANSHNSLFTKSEYLTSIWHPTKNGEITPHDVTWGSSRVFWWLGECGHEWKKNVKQMHQKDNNCPYCNDRRVLIGYNDIETTNSKLGYLLANEEDKYKYTQFSSKRVDWKCCECNYVIKNKKIADINIYGLSCPKCSDGKSYPEKLMFNLLYSLGLDFTNEKSFNWSKRKRYDFYIPSLNMIIETHGKQHYEEGGFANLSGKGLDYQIENDKLKYTLALENGIENYIVIDCKESDLDYIKHNIINSYLSIKLNLDNIDWYDLDKESRKSNLIKVYRLYLSGLTDVESLFEATKFSKGILKKYIEKFEKENIIYN